MPNADSYSTRCATFPGDRAAVVALWGDNLGVPGHAQEKFRWFYENSPSGAPLTMLLECSPAAGVETRELAGVASAGRRSFLMGHEEVTAGVLVDMAVMSRHRTLFPAIVLQKALFGAARVSCRVLYGFPNPKAAPVMQRVGYGKLGVLTRYVKVLRASRYLENKLPAPLAKIAGFLADAVLKLRLVVAARASRDLQLRWLELDEMKLEPQSLSISLPDGLVRGRRDMTFLQWRFAAGRRCKFISVERREGRQWGWWIVERTDDVMVVRDCSISLLNDDGVQHAWSKLAAQAHSLGCSSVSFECLGPEQWLAKLLGIGFTARNDRPVFGAVREADRGPGSWFLTDADEDE